MLLPQKVGKVLILFVAMQLSEGCVRKRRRHEQPASKGQGEYKHPKRIYTQGMQHLQDDLKTHGPVFISKGTLDGVKKKRFGPSRPMNGLSSRAR